jgi:hypothetical protein
LVSATGNVAGNYILGNGSQLTGIVATSVGILPSLSVTGNTQTGNLLTGGLVSATGTITGSSLLGTVVSITGAVTAASVAGGVITGSSTSVTGNVTGGNIATVGQVTATGNVTANYFIGNGSQLTGVATSFAPVMFNDVSTQTNGKTTVFALKQNQTAATGITNSKQLQVTVNGAIQTPYVKTWVWPFWSVYGSYPGFRVTNQGYKLTANSVIIYNAPAVGSQVTVTQINNSTDTQLQRYPYSATAIATSDD